MTNRPTVAALMALASAIVTTAVVTAASPTVAAAAPAPGCTALAVSAGNEIVNPGPVLSADGQHVAYLSKADVAGGNPDGGAELWVLDLATNTRTQLTNRAGRFIIDFAVNRDATTFAYLSSLEQPLSFDSSVRLVRRTPRSDVEVGIANGYSIALSANDRRLAYESSSGLTVRNNVNGAKKVIAGVYSEVGNFDELGQRLVFWSDDDLVGQNGDRVPQVFLQRFGTSPSTTQVTHSAFDYTARPVISGDGSTVVYVAHDLESPGSEVHTEVFRHSVAAGSTRQITSTATIAIAPERPGVSRDGSVIVFEASDDVGGLDVNGRGDVIRYLAATGEFTNLTRHADDIGAVQPSLDGSGTRVVYSAGGGSEYVLSALDCPVPAPRPTISGTVSDTSSGEPVGGAWVMAISTSGRLTAGAITTGTGRYSLTVPTGTYRIETIDPSGRHRGEWYDDHGLERYVDAQTVTPALDGSTVVDVALDPAGSSASIAGTVTDAATGAPLQEVMVFALDARGQVLRGVMTYPDGRYEIDGLPGGTVRLAFLHPSGGYTPLLDQDASAPSATSVAVVPGETAIVDAQLSARPVPPGGATLRGSVTDLAGTTDIYAWVLAFDTAGNFVRATTSGAVTPGGYLMSLAPGNYKLQIVDSLGLHVGEWYDDHDLAGFAAAETVVPGTAARFDAELAPTGPSGVIAGTVSDASSGTPLQGVWVGVVDADSGLVASSGVTDSEGDYTAESLRSGRYRLAFIDPTGAHDFEFHQDTVDFGAATDVIVGAGQTVNVDVELALRP